MALRQKAVPCLIRKSSLAIFSCIIALMSARVFFISLIVLLAACESRAQDKVMIIEVDGQEIRWPTKAKTVGDVLAEAHIQRGPLDRVEPDLNELIERSSRITLTRV